MDEDTKSVSVPLTVRPTEREQMQQWIPKVHERLTSVDLEERAETIEGFTFGPDYVTAADDCWYTFLSELDRISDEVGTTRVEYAKRKWARRLDNRISEVKE